MSEFRNDSLPPPKFVDIELDFPGAALVQKHLDLRYPYFPNLAVLTPVNIFALKNGEDRALADRLQLGMAGSPNPIKDLTYNTPNNNGQVTYDKDTGTVFISQSKKDSLLYQILGASFALMDQYNSGIAVGRFSWMTGANRDPNGLERTILLGAVVAGFPEWVLTETLARESGRKGRLYQAHLDVIHFHNDELIQKYLADKYPYEEARRNAAENPTQTGHRFFTDVMDTLQYRRNAVSMEENLQLAIQNPPENLDHLRNSVWFASKLVSAIQKDQSTSQPEL